MSNPLPEYFEDYCEGIDATLGSGDLMSEIEARRALRSYIARWKKSLSEWDNFTIEEESDEINKEDLEAASDMYDKLFSKRK